MKTLNIGLLGLGTVGSSLVRLLARHEQRLQQQYGIALKLVHVASRRLHRAAELGLHDCHLSTDLNTVVDNPEVDLVVELIGGTSTAAKLIGRSIAAHKHVVTANKALIAEQGPALLHAAAQQRTTIAYEGAVCGGLPIVKAVSEGLRGAGIESICGIINGTANFILSQMHQHHRHFDAALEQAQKLGYAEADPSFDIDGIDSAHKICILATLAFGKPLSFEQVYIQGIRHIDHHDIRHARELGYHIKLLGIAQQQPNGAVELRVHPTLVPQQHMLANVHGIMNAVLINSDVAQTLYHGPGAGGDATASAVLADILDIAQRGRPSAAAQMQKQPQEMAQVLPIEAVSSRHYLHLVAHNVPGVIAAVSQLLADAGASIEAITQKPPVTPLDSNLVPIILRTGKVAEGVLAPALLKIQQLTTIAQPLRHIRVKEFSS